MAAREAIVNFAYLVAAVLFIFGMKGLQHPRTAVRGNAEAAAGMLLAVVATLWDRQIVRFEWIAAGLVIGSAIGAVLAFRARMTAMPQMVAVLNGFGGGASFLVAGVTLDATVGGGTSPSLQLTVAAAMTGIIGGPTLFGSLMAYAKLQGIITERSVALPAQQMVGAALLLVAAGLGAWLVIYPDVPGLYWAIVAVASIWGVFFVLPIGGADMPVAISLLNSFSGLAGATAGFVLSNNALIISGTLVGASGFILTQTMCTAMNRSLANVLSGAVGKTAYQAPAGQEEVYATVKATDAEEVAMLFDNARRVVIVPGYGMAVSGAQYAIKDLVNVLESKGIEVEFGIHPVAGRMPGHMNVLLAEVDIPYEKLRTEAEINPTMPHTDVVLVVGANDVVNPVARNVQDASNPIAGMPIIEVDKARSVVVIKRSLSPGFAGVPNPLFAAQNTLMFFNDGKKAIQELVNAVKSA